MVTCNYFRTLEREGIAFSFDPKLDPSRGSNLWNSSLCQLHDSILNNQNIPVVYYPTSTYSLGTQLKSTTFALVMISYFILIAGLFCDKLIGI